MTDQRSDASGWESGKPVLGSLFWTDDGWLVDLREWRQYPIYGEWDWLVRTNNSGVCFVG